MSDSTILFDNEQLRAQLQEKDRRIRRFVWLFVAMGLVFASIVALLAVLWYLPSRDPASLMVLEQSAAFVTEMDQQFDLSLALLHYDYVINALERYKKDTGAYPTDLTMLVPKYLRTTPGIYLRHGTRLIYTLDTVYRGVDGTPFTFFVYGKQPGLLSMHGWELRYCPRAVARCNAAGDRHFHPFRLNDRWIWIDSSAL